MTYQELEQASEHLAAQRQTNGLKRDDAGLYIEGRTVKSMLKEVTNILFAGARWKMPGNPTGKGPRSFLAERVFVDPDHISLGRQEPDGIELFIGHTSGPAGRQSNLTYYEYVQNARVAFEVKVLKDSVPLEAWPELWLLAQDNGLGALRSQGYGRFDIERWDPL